MPVPLHCTRKRWRCVIKTQAKLYVGIDFSKNDVHVAMHAEDGRSCIQTARYANNQKGYEQLKASLLARLQEQTVAGVEVIGEATSYYWLPLYLQLDQDAQLASYGLRLHLLNARWIKWYKKSISPSHKTDRIDADHLAEYGRTQTPESVWHSDTHWLPLRFYTRLRTHLVRSQTREKNLFDLYLFLAYSSYTQHAPFSDPLALTSRSLLADPAQVERLAGMSLEAMSAALAEVSQQHLPHPQSNAKRFAQVLEDRYPVAPSLALPIQHGLETLLATIGHLEQQIKTVEHWIDELVAKDYPEIAWLDSLPGVGKVLACGIAAEIAGIQRFTDPPIYDRRRNAWRTRRSSEVADAVAKYAGLWWPKNASGQFEAEERVLSREGNAYLRYYILQAADRMRLRIPSFKAYYLQKYGQAHRHKHKRALVLTGCKALDLCVTLLRRREVYRPEEVND